jgi:type I restriction enzyme S subunit
MEIKSPTLRFKDFSEPWERVSLEEIITLISGQHLSPEQYNADSKGTPYFTGPSDFTNDKYGVTKYSRVKSKLAVKGDILITVKGSGVGEMMVLGLPEVAMGRQLMAIRASNKVCNVFLFNRLQKNKRQFLALASGNMIPGLSRTDITSTKLLLPSLQEQEIVSDFLSAVDKKISLLKEKYALLEQYKKGVMQKLFKQEIRFKDDSGSDFPDWKILKLSEISTPIKRRASTSVDKIMTISAGKGFLSQEERFSQVIAGTSLEKYIHLKKGEFSYNRGNSKSYTYGCIYKLEEEEALVPYVYRSFSLDKGNTEFFAQLFKFKYLDRQLRRLISSSARMDGLLNIGEKEFYQVKVPFPQEAEQIKIANFLDSLDMKLNSIAEQIELTQTFKKGLLQQMFV